VQVGTLLLGEAIPLASMAPEKLTLKGEHEREDAKK
jgi:hypothetical protein